MPFGVGDGRKLDRQLDQIVDLLVHVPPLTQANIPTLHLVGSECSCWSDRNYVFALLKLPVGGDIKEPLSLSRE